MQRRAELAELRGKAFWVGNTSATGVQKFEEL